MKSSPKIRALIWLVLLAGVVVFGAPLVWMVATTMKLDHELVRRPVRWLPDLEVAPAQGPWTDRDGREHRLGLGRVIAVTPEGEEISLERRFDELPPWQGAPPMESEANPELRLWSYDLNLLMDTKDDVFTVPAEVNEIDHLIVEVENDRSFHRLDVKITWGDTVWSSSMHVIGNDESQDLVLRFPGDESRRAGDLELREVTDLVIAQVRDQVPGFELIEGEGYQFTAHDSVLASVRLHRSSPLRAAWYKFTEQYRRALVYLDFWSFTRNSIYLVVLNCIGAVLASSLVAFSFARLRWHGRDVLFLLLLATMMLPPQVTMVPQFLIWRGLGFFDTLVPLWLPAFFAIPFFVFLLRQFMLTIPRDLEDAARIDGCSALGIWGRVILPLIKPALIAVAIFQFLFTWNDFMGPLIYVANPALQPLSVGVYIFNQAFAGQWGMILAAATMMLIPVLVMFFCAQRHFIEGVTLTGLKA